MKKVKTTKSRCGLTTNAKMDPTAANVLPLIGCQCERFFDVKISPYRCKESNALNLGHFTSALNLNLDSIRVSYSEYFYNRGQ